MPGDFEYPPVEKPGVRPRAFFRRKLSAARVFILIALFGRSLWPPVILLKKQLIGSNRNDNGDERDEDKEKHFVLTPARIIPFRQSCSQK